jgi:hypothetical protein
VTERKIDNMHVLELYKAKHKNDVKISGQRNRKRRKKRRKKREKGESDGKKDGQYAFFRNICKARFKCDVKIDGNKG